MVRPPYCGDRLKGNDMTIDAIIVGGFLAMILVPLVCLGWYDCKSGRTGHVKAKTKAKAKSKAKAKAFVNSLINSPFVNPLIKFSFALPLPLPSPLPLPLPLPLNLPLLDFRRNRASGL